MRIGIGITTHNRKAMLQNALVVHKKYLPDNCSFVVVDDGSTDPVGSIPFGTLITHTTSKGIARSKNACMARLMQEGCDHIFLFDDDTTPAMDNWWVPYISSKQPHLMYMWGDSVIYQDDEIIGYNRPKGCMLYVTREVIERVGGMDPEFGVWGFEHESWSDRIFNAGFTTCRYQDVLNSKDLIYAADRQSRVDSSVPESVRVSANPYLAEMKRNSDEYVSLYDTQQAVASNKIKLSILVPSVNTRWNTFARKIQEQLYSQYDALTDEQKNAVEIIILSDTKSINLGDKRNKMVGLASGDYVVFVDDDDRLEPDYISSLLQATESGADVLTFFVSVVVDGSAPRKCNYSLKWPEDSNTNAEYRRLPNHICAVKRSIALRTPFPSKLCGEDKEYAIELRPLLKTEYNIPRVLYHYDYSRLTTETQLAQRYQHLIVRRSRPPVADLVILSKATTPALKAMTQHAIDSAIKGAGDININVIVVEQVPTVRYKKAITVHNESEFGYNRFCNYGAKRGNAPWIVFANNDLSFEAGWLAELIAVRHECVSPHNPGDGRQMGLSRNERGDVNGRHFSGWCFMLSRPLWKRIGGLDEDFEFWCADDATIEQVMRVGVKPMLVNDSRVHHLVSKTVSKEAEDDGRRTWLQVERFNKKYGRDKFKDDPRYTKWKSTRKTEQCA